MTIPIDFLKEGEEFKLWRKENKVSDNEMIDVLCNILRCYHAIRFHQMKEELNQVRQHRKEKTEAYKIEEAARLSKIEAEKQERIKQEMKVLDDLNKPIPLTASAEEAMAIRFGEDNETKSNK
jgi:hypothetical protein